jgi:DNA invertase Pin-like site-specific DNA recombinase
MTSALRIERAAVPDDARTIVYVRVSTDDQKDKAVSPAEQERLCREFVTSLKRTVDHVWDRDLGVSGTDWSRLERLAAWAEAHRRPKAARGLIVALKRDRWERFVHSATAAAFYEERLARAGWTVDFALEKKSGDRTADGVMAAVHGSQAASESEEKSRRARMGRKDLAERGDWAGRPPFGYDRVATSRATGKARTLAAGESAAKDPVKLEPNADAATVKRIFARFAAGESLNAICTALNAADARGPWDVYPNPWGSERWRACVLRIVIGNPVYTGDTVAMRRCNTGEKKAPVRTGVEDMQDVRIVRDSAEWISRKTHAPLVDGRTFAACQGRLHPRAGQARRSNDDWWLSGLLVCGTCGGPLVGGGGTGVNRFYRCQGAADDKHAAPRCPAPRLTVNKALIEREVVARVAAHVADLVQSGGLARALQRALGGDASDRRSAVALDKEKARLEAARGRVVDAVADGTLERAAVKAKLDEIAQALARLVTERAQHKMHVGLADRQAEVKRLVARATDFGARVAAAPPALRRELVSVWLDRAVVAKPKQKAGPLAIGLTVRYSEVSQVCSA